MKEYKLKKKIIMRRFKEIKEVPEINSLPEETTIEIIGDGIAEECGKEPSYTQSILGDEIGEEM